MNQLTGSKLPILKHCQYFARDDVQWPTEATSAAAGRGIDIHEAIDKDTLVGVDFGDIKVVERGRAYIRALRASGWQVELEVPLALNLKTGMGRRLKSSGHRDYSDLKPGEVGLTVDYFAVKFADATNDAEVEVGDWKTGWGSHVERPKDNWQTGAAASALSEMFGDCAVMVKIHYLDADHVDSWLMSGMEAQQFAVAIRATLGLATSMAKPNPGEHCRYCPARTACPAVQGAIVKVGAQLAIDRPVTWTLERLSVENDAMMAMHLPALKAALEAMEKALKERSRDGLPLPNGKVWKPILKKRTGLDTERVRAFLGPRAEEFIKVTEYEAFQQVKP